MKIFLQKDNIQYYYNILQYCDDYDAFPAM